VDFGSSVTKTPHGTIYCLTIVGQIEGHMLASQTAKTTKYEHVMPLLASLEEDDDIAGVLFLLNTVGGDIEAGLGIAELIAGMSKPTVSLVLGGSHSIGAPLAVAAKTELRRAVGGHDHPPRAHERHRHRRAPDLQLF
jgi:ATP-dependent protease ClpP protease subunit